MEIKKLSKAKVRVTFEMYFDLTEEDMDNCVMINEARQHGDLVDTEIERY